MFCGSQASAFSLFVPLAQRRFGYLWFMDRGSLQTWKDRKEYTLEGGIRKLHIDMGSEIGSMWIWTEHYENLRVAKVITKGTKKHEWKF